MAQAGSVAPRVSWYWRGSTAANGTSLTLNSASTLILGCSAKATTVFSPVAYPAFVITKGSIMTTYAWTAATADTTPASLSVSGGTVLFDSFNGNGVGYDYMLISSGISIISTTQTNGYLTMYIPSLSTTDAGTYYCNYIDGAAAASTTTTSFASSGSFTVTVTTKSASGSIGFSSVRNKPLEYSVLLLGASKMLW